MPEYYGPKDRRSISIYDVLDANEALDIRAELEAAQAAEQQRQYDKAKR